MPSSGCHCFRIWCHWCTFGPENLSHFFVSDIVVPTLLQTPLFYMSSCYLINCIVNISKDNKSSIEGTRSKVYKNLWQLLFSFCSSEIFNFDCSSWLLRKDSSYLHHDISCCLRLELCQALFLYYLDLCTNHTYLIYFTYVKIILVYIYLSLTRGTKRIEGSYTFHHKKGKFLNNFNCCSQKIK